MPNPWKIPVTKYVQLNHNHNNTGNKAHQNSVIHSIRQSSCCPAALTLSSRTLTFPNTSLPYWIASDVSTQQMEWQCSVDPFVVNEFCPADQWFSSGFTGPWLKKQSQLICVTSSTESHQWPLYHGHENAAYNFWPSGCLLGTPSPGC